MGTKKFQYKLWRAVNECKSGALRWSEAGDSVIFDMDKFKREYLDPCNSFSKSSSVSSFIRQLNLYGFRKMADIIDPEHLHGESGKEYANPNFLKDRYDLLVQVTRANSRPSMTMTDFMKSNGSSEDEALKGSQTSGRKKRHTRGRRRKRIQVDLSENMVRRSSRPRKPVPKYSPVKDTPRQRSPASTEIEVSDMEPSRSPEWMDYFNFLLRAHDVPPPTVLELNLAQAVPWTDEDNSVFTREGSGDILLSQACGVSRPHLCKNCTDPVWKQEDVQ